MCPQSSQWLAENRNTLLSVTLWLCRGHAKSSNTTSYQLWNFQCNPLSYSEVFEQSFCTTLGAQDQSSNKNTNLDMVSSQLQPKVVGVSIWKLLRPASVCAWKCPKLCLSPELIQQFIVLLAYQNQAIRVHPNFAVAARKISQRHPFLFISALKDESGASLPFVLFFHQLGPLSQ